MGLSCNTAQNRYRRVIVAKGDQKRIAALLANLTEPQAEAVQHTEGPLLVLAGAGAGKTRVITRRAAHLALTVTDPRNVLAITFTNKAADEMRERIMALGVGQGMTVGTFHAFCARLLRIHHERARLPSDFTIFDTADQRRLLKDAIEMAGLAPDNWTPARVQTVISRAKNAMVTAEAFAERQTDWLTRSVARVYSAYEKLLSDQHGLDFDDLLLKPAILLRGDAELRREIERRYTHVLIDEYQDTNAAQYEIVRLITERNHNLCATGDPDQSIYGWRGADIGNILRFEKDYPEAKVVRLEQNYRSTRRILSAASAVIEHNVARKEKTLWTENPEGGPVRVVRAETAEQEARFLADELDERRHRGEDLSEVAVFYRTNALSRAVEEALLTAGIPYQVARGVEFYNRKEIKDVLAYLRVLVNHRDEVSLERIINTPTRGIGQTTVDRLKAHARATGQPLYEVVVDPGQVPSLGRRAVEKVTLFAEVLASLGPVVELPPPEALGQVLILSGLEARLAGQAEYDREPLDNVNELINAAVAFDEDHSGGTLLDWLQHTSLLGDVDAIDDSGGAVTLMTLHAAKGLEFSVVYMIALEEGLLPFHRDPSPPDYDDEEEERRLCFVGMTRTKRELTLSYCHYRMTRGKAERKMRSMFLNELPADEIGWVDASGASVDEAFGRPAGHLPDDSELWEEGTLVRHPNRGLGRIVRIQPNGADSRLLVRFPDGSERVFILQYSGLERVDFDEADFD